MKQILHKGGSIQKQQGVVLAVSLIMLLVITGLGVSAVRLSNNQTQVAGNSIYSTMAFHGAESALARIASPGSEKNIADIISTNNPARVRYMQASELFDNNETINNETTIMSSKAEIRLVRGIKTCPPSSSNEITSDSFKCRFVTVTVETSLPGTGARAKHSETRAKKVLINY